MIDDPTTTIFALRLIKHLKLPFTLHFSLGVFPQFGRDVLLVLGYPPTKPNLFLDSLGLAVAPPTPGSVILSAWVTTGKRNMRTLLRSVHLHVVANKDMD